MKMFRHHGSAGTLRDQVRRGGIRLRVLGVEEAEREDREYWHSRSPLERLRHVEALRELNYGPQIIDQGLQRVLAVLERSRG